jgi:hypothetical protein
VSRTESETLLEVSIRWSHVQIVNYLLEDINWTKDEIKLAFRHVIEEDESNAIRVMLE